MPSRALTAASSRPLILSILSHGESYGYKLIKDVETMSGGFLEWTEAMLYPVLHRLEKEGLIQSRWHVAESGRKRKYYSLTPAGRSAMQEERAEWQRVHNVLDLLWTGTPELSPS